MIKVKQENFIYLIMMLLAAVFVILKMIRGFSATEETGGLWNLIQVLFIGIGCIYLASKGSDYRHLKCLRIYTVFFLYVWFLSLFPFLFGPKTMRSVFGFLTVPYGLMVMITFFSIAKKVPIKKYSEVLLIGFFIISAILFVAMRSFRLQMGIQGALADVYYIVGLLPLVMLYLPRRFSIIPFLVALVCVAMTGKRGAFVALGLIFIVYYFIPFNRGKKNVFLIWRILLLSIVIVLSYYVLMRFIGQYNLGILDRLDTMEEDGGSGRVVRWSKLLSMVYLDTNLFQLLFGHGNGYVYSEVGGHAHNDFLEFLCDYGLFAFVLYIVFFASMFREGVRMYKKKYIYAREFMCSMMVSICMALFSFYAIDCTHITCCSICQGLILADWYKFKNAIS